MEQPSSEERMKELRDLATALLQQAEHCAAAGQSRQAITLFGQLWWIADGREPEVANTAAWEAGWLSLRLGAYGDAAQWFTRSSIPPSRPSRLWPAARTALAELCGRLASAGGDQHVVPPASTTSAAGLTAAKLPPLEVSTLGRLEIVRGGVVLPFYRARKPIAILRYLLTRRQYTAHKDELTELLWPDSSPRDAGHSLHVAVSALRRHLDLPNGSYLVLEAGSYVLNPDAAISSDGARFVHQSEEADRFLRAGDLDLARDGYMGALARYGGDFFVEGGDGTWAIAERERLLTRYLSNLDHLGAVLMAQQSWEPAADCYARLLDRDSYREDAYAQLMRCLQALGRREAAVHQYQRCRAILQRDLGLEPMPELTAIYSSIMNGTGP